MSAAYQRGSLLYAQKRYAMAAAEFQMELSQNPQYAPAMAMLALSLLENGDKKEALRTVKAAIAIDPDYAFAHYALSHCILGGSRGMGPRSFRLVSNRRRVKALVPANEAVRLDPRNANYMALLANIEFNLQRPAKALKWADQGLAIQPDHVSCANLRARALTRLGRVDEAKQTLKQVLALDPENASTHTASGWASLQAGEPERALEHFTQTVRLNPNDPHAIRGLSRAKAANHPLLYYWFQIWYWLSRTFGKVQIICVILLANFLRGILTSIKSPSGDGAAVSRYGATASAAVIIPIMVLILLCRPVSNWWRRRRTRTGT